MHTSMRARFLTLVILTWFSVSACQLVQSVGNRFEPTTTPEPTSTPLAVNCSDLGSTWISGTAKGLPDGVGYDTSACERMLGSTRLEVVKPAERDPVQWAGARCNDGTPFGFWVQLAPGRASDDWIIYLRGGGFCDDLSSGCAERSNHLTTTLTETDRSSVAFQGAGIFLRNPEKNPQFYNANYIIAQYCSSDAWSGATAQRRPNSANPEGWYFSGRVNVEAMFESLSQRYGLDDANKNTRILFAGSSAGGIGVEVNADTAARLFPNAAGAGRLKILNDGGLIVNYDDPLHRPGNAPVPVRDLVVAAYDFWGARHNPICEADQIQKGEHPGLCFLGSVNYRTLTEPEPEGLGLPYLVQLSSLDSSALQLHGLLDLDNPDNREAIEAWREAALSDLKQVEWLFSGGSRPYHTLLLDNQAIQMGPGEYTFYQLLALFWDGGEAVRLVFGNP